MTPIYKWNANLQIANQTIRRIRDSRNWHTIRILASRRGFTLLEMLIALGIFSVVMIITVGAVLALQQAQVKASRIQDMQDNLRFSVESMTKEMRTGTDFLPSGAISGLPNGYDQLVFTRSDGVQIGYCRTSNAIRKMTAIINCTSGAPVTDDAIAVEQLVFYVIGNALGPSDGQPRITIALRASSADPILATTFRIQTTVTQRLRDQ